MPDAVLEALATRAKGPAVPQADPVLAALSERAAGKATQSVTTTLAERERQFREENPQPTSMWDMNPSGNPDAGKFLLGLPELAISAVTGAAGTLADVATLDDPGTHNWGYQPRTGPGKFAAQKVAGVIAPIAEAAGAGYDKAFGMGPLAQTLKERLPQAAEAISTVAGAGGASKVLRRTGEIAPGESPLASVARTGFENESMGAAAASLDLGKVSPPIRQAIQEAAGDGSLNRQVLTRHLEADTLPIPVKLTRGQAMQDPVQLSAEQNMRGKNPALARVFNEQNQQLIENLDEIRREVSPQVVHSDHIQNGQALIDSYKQMDAPVQADINAKYGALRDAAGGEFPIDTGTLLANVKSALKKDLATAKAPSDVMAALEEAAATGSMPLEDFEALRTALARIQRTSSDGQERHAAGIIREQVESLPLQESSSELKKVADIARNAAKSRFARIKADPAYKAAVEDGVDAGDHSPLADDFISKYVVKGKGANIKKMRENLAADPVASETISAGALNYLKSKSGVNLFTNDGNFSQAGYNRALSELTPRLPDLVAPEVADQLQALGNVARYTQAQPRGSFVNNSNTFVASAFDKAGRGLEGVINFHFGGLPVGTGGRKWFEARKERNFVEKSTEPAAGIRLRDLPKGEKK